jgi:hypothetical protein
MARRRRRKTRSKALGQTPTGTGTATIPDTPSVRASEAIANAEKAILEGRCLSAARQMARAAYLYGASYRKKDIRESVQKKFNTLSADIGLCFLGNPNAKVK